jgi:hypothetical protein
MLDFIDISCSLSDRNRPYQVLRFERGAVAEIVGFLRIETLAAYCKRHAVPVVTSSPHLSSELQAHGIAAQTFETQEVSALETRQVGEA